MNGHIITIRKFWLWPTIVLLGMVVVWVIPGGFVEKSRMLLHGLCAQTPGHTYNFGGQPLPFDARMTGIYSGAIVTLAYLAIRGRVLAMDLPAPRHLVVLAGFAVLMAVDGFNSLFTDLGLWHPWESTNSLRVITGFGMGVTLAVALVWLVAGTVFQVARKQAAIQRWQDFVLPIVILPVILMLLNTGWAWLHVPLSIFLMVSAWIVLGTLALVTVLLATRIDERIVRIGQLHIPGAVGLLIGMIVMLTLAFGRSWLERTLGIPTTI